MPKELVNKNTVCRPQTLSTKPIQNGDADHRNIEVCPNEAQDSPQKPKIERTKSILKQSSKEKELVEMPSPKKENITFAAISDSHFPRYDNEEEEEKELIKACDSNEVDRETQCDIGKNINQTVVSTGTEVVDLEAKTIDKQIGE